MRNHCELISSAGPVLARTLGGKFVQKEFHHELVSVTITRDAADSRRYRTGSPVEIQWGHRPNKIRSFFGYVNHVEPVLAQEDVMTVVCVGSTYPLKSGGYLTLRDMTASQLVDRVAQQFRLTPITQAHPKLWAMLVQGGRSYWDLLVEYAHKVGFSLYPVGTQLYFHERSTAAAQFNRNIPLLVPRVGQGPGILKFRSQQGANTPTGGRNVSRAVYGVDDRMVAPFYWEDPGLAPKPYLGQVQINPVFSEGQSDLIVSHPGDASERLKGQRLANELTIQARAQVTGNPYLRPGIVVFVDGVSELDRGLWYIEEATHEIRSEIEYTIDLVLGRDAQRAAPQYPFSTPIENTSRSSRLIAGQWVAA